MEWHLVKGKKEQFSLRADCFWVEKSQSDKDQCDMDKSVEGLRKEALRRAVLDQDSLRLYWI